MKIEYNNIKLKFYDNLKEIFYDNDNIFSPIIENIKKNTLKIKNDILFDCDEKIFDYNMIFVLKKDNSDSIDIEGYKDIMSLCSDGYKSKIFSKNENLKDFIKNIFSFKEFICNNKILKDRYDKGYAVDEILFLDKCYLLYDEFKKERNLLK